MIIFKNMTYKTIFINLKAEKTRLKFMTNQLNSLKILFERLEAVNGKEYLENGGNEYDEKLTLKNHYSKLTNGEIGCALSHKRCYQKFLNDPAYKDIKYLLILEDDVELDKNFKNIIEKEIKKNEEKYKWNYLQFNYPKIIFSLKEKYKTQFIIFKTSKEIKNRIKRLPFLILSPLFSSFLGFIYIIYSKKRKIKNGGVIPYFKKMSALTGAYLIDKKTASILLNLTKKIIWPADITTSEKLYKYKSKRMNFYFYYPLIAKQKIEEFKSNIFHEKI